MMSWIDWVIVIIPTAFVYWMGMYSRKYLRDVSTFLSSGRVCGRYVISVGDIASSLSVTGLMAYVEVHYRTGFATAFWSALLTPLWVLMGLYGFVTYRFRETKAQSIGQFLEMRYSRKFRIFAAGLRSISEMLANMIMPALAARFFIYFLGWPKTFELCGIEISTFHALVLGVLIMAISIICMGGSMAIIITDTIQGFLCYPMLVVFTVFILMKFDWSGQMLPVLSDRVDGESFLNPNDIENLRDFNLFSLLLLPIVVGFLHRASWIGAGSSSTAARSPHEQKMASLLGSWRSALGGIFYVLIAVAVLTLLNHKDFSEQAHKIRLELTDKVAMDVVSDPQVRSAVVQSIHKLPAQELAAGVQASEKNNLDVRYLSIGHEQLKLKSENVDQGNAMFQKFRTLYYQLMLPVTLRNMLPKGMLGLFCLMMVLLMVSTDDSRIFSAAITVSQDVVLQFRKKKLTPKE
ncbi:MAG: sodium:panthothenate symporter, partial [Lentisphaeria bacterium]|nr:sodium:panthothenate symporter [Lentisphaeria bacterium]